MHIAFILSALQAGGAERVVNILAGAAVGRGWAVTVITFDRPDEPIFHVFPDQVRLVRLALPAGPANVIRRIRALRRELAGGGYDVAISFLTKINATSLSAAWSLKVPLVISERNHLRLQTMHPAWKIALPLLYRRADQIIVQTARSMSCLPARQRARAIVIANPVELPASPERRSTRRTIAAVGRLTWQKGFDRLIDAFALLSRSEDNVRLVIWGEGPLKDRLQHQIDALGLTDKVELAGLSPSHAHWLAQTDVFVLSSRYEGFPNALLEAMAAGLPVIAYDCEFGPGELIEPEVNGLIVPDGAEEMLAQAMKRLVHDPSLADALGRTARDSVARFDRSLITQKWMDIASTLVKKNHRF